jgi:hypothetical protein
MNAHFRALAISSLLVLHAVCVHAEETAGTAVFTGTITPEAVAKFIEDHPKGTVSTLVITSAGGDGNASLTLGRWVKENRLDVRVREYCASGCACAFMAGKKKIIEPGSIVIWHGSLEQKKFRDLHARYQRLLLKARKGEALEPGDEAFLEENERRFLSLLESREAVARFFDEVQVNEYITRIGREPVDFGVDGWTATVPVMNKFGILNIDAADDYGQPDYIARVRNSLPLCKGSCVTFVLDSSGMVQRLEWAIPKKPRAAPASTP